MNLYFKSRKNIRVALQVKFQVYNFYQDSKIETIKSII